MKPCDTSKMVPLVITNIRGDTVDFPAGVHRLLRPIAKVALERAGRKSHYVIEDKTCWGYSCRKIEGSDTWSQHAYGLAIDVNAPENPRGTNGNLPHRFVRTMKYFGFEWGGDWDFTDPMHFQFVGPLRRASRQAKRLLRRLSG